MAAGIGSAAAAGAAGASAASGAGAGGVQQAETSTKARAAAPPFRYFTMDISPSPRTVLFFAFAAFAAPDDLAADDGHHRLHVQDVTFGDDHQVAVEDRKVGKLAGLDGAEIGVLKGGIGRTCREQAEGLRAGQRFFWVPALAGEAFQVLAGDGGIEFDQG